MTYRKFWLGTVAPISLLVLQGGAAISGTLDGNPLIGTSGDGLIFADPAEGVLEPGVGAVTFTGTRVDDGMGGFIYVDPYEEIITDFSDLSSR